MLAAAATAACCNFKSCQTMVVLVESSVLSGALRQVKRWRPPTRTDVPLLEHQRYLFCRQLAVKWKMGKRTAGKSSPPPSIFPPLASLSCPPPPPLSPPCVAAVLLPVEAITLDSLLCHRKSFCLWDAAAERRSVAHVCTQD